jgi:hypothetical protein
MPTRWLAAGQHATITAMPSDQTQVRDLSDIIDASHENKWVAIAPDYSRVIGAADTLRVLMASIADQDAIYYRVLPHDVSFAPAA